MRSQKDLLQRLVTVGKNESAETPKSLVVQEGCEEEGCSAGTGIRTTQGPKRKADAKRDLSPHLLKIADESVVRLVPSRPVLYPLAVQSHGNIATTVSGPTADVSPVRPATRSSCIASGPPATATPLSLRSPRVFSTLPLECLKPCTRVPLFPKMKKKGANSDQSNRKSA
jgi:hypothetical protein